MTPMQKFLKLASETDKKPIAVDDIEGLKAILAEKGKDLTPEEREIVFEEITSDRHVLSDDDLENVAGGAWNPIDVQIGGCKKCGGDVLSVYAKRGDKVDFVRWVCTSCELEYYLV